MSEPANPSIAARTSGASAALALADGSVYWGAGLGAVGVATGELCFNTSMTGYQEIITDPSYAGQIITFTFPHIGNVGANDEDMEARAPAARGIVVRTAITAPSSFRAAVDLDSWLKRHGLVGVSGIDTRRLTHLIRDGGPQTATIRHAPDRAIDTEALVTAACAWPGLEGMDLARDVSCTQTYRWSRTRWRLGRGFGEPGAPRFRVVAIDYGAKRNILRCLTSAGCEVTVVPASAEAGAILAQRPDGIFLSNGPGDPAATAAYAVPTIRRLLAAGRPIFGICLGHQLLALALGATSRKMARGHRGANHPVKDLDTGRVEITAQNHGFVIEADSLPEGVTATHTSLFDGSLEGLRIEDKPVFSVQYHPEASPGPQDSHYLFDRFTRLMELG